VDGSLAQQTPVYGGIEAGGTKWVCAIGTGPMIYYGDEIGLATMGPEYARIPMPWACPERWNQAAPRDHALSSGPAPRASPSSAAACAG
jgi:hypothetical protein